MLELGTKVLGNTASAILQVRSQLNREMIDRTVELLARAHRVEFFNRRPSTAAWALDAQFKFLRFGIPSGATTDPRLQSPGGQRAPARRRGGDHQQRWPPARDAGAGRHGEGAQVRPWWRSPPARARWRARPTPC